VLDCSFSAFPGGWPGISLLLLRSVLGLALLVEGRFYLGEPEATVGTWVLGLSALATGGLLLVGLLTPFAGSIVVLGAFGVLLSLFPSSTPNVFDSKSATVFASAMLVTIIGAGPGRYSADARIFGRREVIIPPRGY
jgi:hypothetical protein